MYSVIVPKSVASKFNFTLEMFILFMPVYQLQHFSKGRSIECSLEEEENFMNYVCEQMFVCIGVGKT